jgi:hypothetical protein
MSKNPPPVRRFELISKHKSTITNIDILSLKMGQVDVKPALCISFITSMPNKEVLPMFSKNLLAFLYENTGRGPTDLVGVAPVTDIPNLTAEAAAIGAISWEYEQTGCQLTVYEGNSKRVLTGGAVRKVKLDAKEGGTVDTYWQFYTAENVDDEVIGHMGILKSLERDVELTAPEIVSAQKDLIEPAKKDARQTPAGALSAALGQTSETAH